MSKTTLVLMLPRGEITGETTVAWSLVAQGAAHCQVTHSAISDISAALNTAQDRYWTLVLAPAEAIALHPVDLPTRQLQKVKQALPYALAELVGEEIVKVHLAIPDKLPGVEKPLPVAAVSHSDLIHWLDVLHHNGLAPDEIVADAWCCPDLGGVTAVVCDDRVLLRRDSHEFAAMPVDMLEEALEQWQTGSTEALNLCWFSGQEAVARGFAGAFVGGDKAEDCRQRQYRETWEAGLILTAAGQAGSGINLLTGGYSESRKQRHTAGTGRWPALAVAAAVTFLSACIGTAWIYEQRASEFQRQQISLLRQVLPSTGRIVNPRKQLAAAMSETVVDSGGFAFAMGAVGSALSRSGAQVEVNAIRFLADQRQLELEIAAVDANTLQGLNRELSSSGGINSRLLAQRSEAGRTTATLQMELL